MRLTVYYALERGPDEKLIWRDDEIEALVGRKSSGSGVFVPTGERDIEFRLSEFEMARAKKELAVKGFRYEVAS